MRICLSPMKKLLGIFNATFLKWSTIFTLGFIALYPKLPSVHITRTWVYVRLEDFLISFLVILWAILLVRKKVKLPFPLGYGIVSYWIVGLATTLVSITIFGSHLANFFPKIAALEYVRRIEYMILFFVAFSTIKKMQDVWHYMIGLVITIAGFTLYGLGQHFYLYFWQAFPKFFEKLTFCFPSYQTGNEEFAKGLALCLPENARVTSTFGGHYDLAAYLVVALPVLFVFMLSVTKRWAKIGLATLFVLATMVLIFTSSRISFAAFLIGTSATLVFIKRKKLILPVWIVSIILLLIFSGSLAKRFLQTIRVASVVTNNQGQVVGVTESSLPQDLKSKISKNDTAIQANQPVPNGDIPAGTAFNILPQNPVATSVAVVKNSLSPAEAQKLRLENGGLQISTVSGSFLIQKALVYDISFTTRFQGEWPHAWAAFMTFPPLGTGYSSITLATDNDYLRLLGESGFLGFISFMAVFFMLGVFLKDTEKNATSSFPKMLGYALAGGVIGLLINASLIDVFEASKVAESLWILLGVGVGALALADKKQINYLPYAKRILSSNWIIAVYFFIATFAVFGASIGNFFIGDDFTWLKWAATSTFHDVITYFTNAQGFFYRPLAKTVMLGLYTFFSFQPQGYHVFILIVHFLTTLGVYFIARQVFKNKFWAAVAAAFFLVIPSNMENIFWIATLSINLCVLFSIYGLLAFLAFREKKQGALFLVISITCSLAAMFSYELGVIFPLLVLVTDVVLLQKRLMKKDLWVYISYVLSLGIYGILRIHSHAIATSGDYSYNVSHLLQNIVGNLFGYTTLFLFGEPALGWNEFLRTNLRSFATAFGIGIVLVVLAVGVMLYKTKAYTSWIANKKLRLLWYGVLFLIVSLVPYIGLGNLSPRYGYLAAVGFVILLTMLIQKVVSVLPLKGEMQKYTGTVAISLAILGFFVIGVKGAMIEWNSASTITLNTLKYFRVYHEEIPKGATVYVANMPIRSKNAWVFPVGFPDALWFIYRDDSLVVNKISVDQATQLATESKKYPYVFSFDTTGSISQVK